MDHQVPITESRWMIGNTFSLPSAFWTQFWSSEDERFIQGWTDIFSEEFKRYKKYSNLKIINHKITSSTTQYEDKIIIFAECTHHTCCRFKFYVKNYIDQDSEITVLVLQSKPIQH